MEIQSYIKDLLLLNDCVIIPDLGGFVSNYKPAQIKHNRFSPPSKEIAFNPKLHKNDGLLINFISEQDGVGYFEAKQRVENFVEESVLKLQRYEKLVFQGVGQLYYDRMENLQFEPAIEQNLLVDAYGLEDFSYEKLYQRLVPEPAIKIQHTEGKPVIFSRRNVKKVLIGAPLLLALALIPMKKTNDIMNHSDLNIFTQLTEVVAPAQEIASEPEEVITAPVEELNNRYFLIGGSFKEEKNATDYIEQMKAKGFHPENLGVFNGLYRISIESYPNMTEAKNQLNAMRSNDPKSGVWIHIKQ